MKFICQMFEMNQQSDTVTIKIQKHAQKSWNTPS